MKQIPLIFAVLLSVSGCGPQEETVENPTVYKYDKKTFDKEFAAWQAAGIKNYRYTFNGFDEGSGPTGVYTITVQENTTTDIKPPDNPHHQDFIINSILLKDIYQIYNRINKSFEHIEAVKKNGGYDNKGAKIEIMEIKIKYNTQYHYPKEVAVFWSYKTEPGPTLIGGGTGYDFKVPSFTPLP